MPFHADSPKCRICRSRHGPATMRTECTPRNNSKPIASASIAEILQLFVIGQPFIFGGSASGQLEEMLAVINQFGDRFADIVEREMRRAFSQTRRNIGTPAFGKFFQSAHIKIAVMEEALEL